MQMCHTVRLYVPCLSSYADVMLYSNTIPLSFPHAQLDMINYPPSLQDLCFTGKNFTVLCCSQKTCLHLFI
jgi:hypothetical protein